VLAYAKSFTVKGKTMTVLGFRGSAIIINDIIIINDVFWRRAELLRQ